MRQDLIAQFDESIGKLGAASAVRKLSYPMAKELYVALGGSGPDSEADIRQGLTLAAAEYSPDTPLSRRCEGCGTEAAVEALVWGKANEFGEPVTVFFPEELRAWLSGPVEFAVDFWNAKTLPATPILELVDDPSADIRVSIKYIDGPGKTLGMTYVPATGDEMDVAGWAGDIYIDVDVFRWSSSKLNTIIAHEVGHALGIKHSKSRSSIMWPSYTRPHKHISRRDEETLRGMYPGFFAPTEQEPSHTCELGE